MCVLTLLSAMAVDCLGWRKRQIVILWARIRPPNQHHCKVNFATCIWFEELTQVFVQILWVFWQRHRYSDSQNWPRSLLVSYHRVLSYHLTPRHHCQHITNMVSNINKHLLYRAINICFWHYNSSSKSKIHVGFWSIANSEFQSSNIKFIKLTSAKSYTSTNEPS